MAAAPEQDRIPVVGLTGAIAAGKSEALAAFARHGAEVLSTDAVVHELLATERVRDLLVGRWGEGVAPAGEVDRARVGAIVFDRPDELGWLESTLHPLVGERIVAWRQGLAPGTPLAVIEVPLLFEADLDGVFDATVAVTAPDDARVERAGARGTLDLEQRAGRQLSQSDKAARATHVLENDGSLEHLDRRVESLVAELITAEDDSR